MRASTSAGTPHRADRQPDGPEQGGGAVGVPLTVAQRRGRIVGFAATIAATATVALVDPGRSTVFPPCPSRTLLGLDCPACGGLHGTHDLLHGRVGEALDHNLLLPGCCSPSAWPSPGGWCR